MIRLIKRHRNTGALEPISKPGTTHSRDRFPLFLPGFRLPSPQNSRTRCRSVTEEGISVGSIQKWPTYTFVASGIGLEFASPHPFTLGLSVLKKGTIIHSILLNHLSFPLTEMEERTGILHKVSKQDFAQAKKVGPLEILPSQGALRGNKRGYEQRGMVSPLAQNIRRIFPVATRF